MTDKREEIIARLFNVISGVAGFRTKARNRIAFDDSQLPAVSVLEGDEDVSDSDSDKGRPSLRPYRITATPQVFIRVGSNGAGTDMNELRDAVLNAVLGDAELNALSLNGRGIRYMGMQSTLHAGRWSEMAATALMFGITYTFNPQS